MEFEAGNETNRQAPKYASHKPYLFFFTGGSTSETGLGRTQYAVDKGNLYTSLNQAIVAAKESKRFKIPIYLVPMSAFENS
jgi:hypothetical protein